MASVAPLDLSFPGERAAQEREREQAGSADLLGPGRRQAASWLRRLFDVRRSQRVSPRAAAAEGGGAE